VYTAFVDPMDEHERICEIRDKGYCVLRVHFPRSLLDRCRESFWPVLSAYLAAHRDEPNRGPHRHFIPMPFDPPCFAPEFFFDPGVLAIAHGLLGRRIVADQWGCDVPLQGSLHQEAHVDYRHPLFAEAPDLPLPVYVLVVSFGLVRIAPEHGPIEIAPGTHRMPRSEALDAVKSSAIKMDPVQLEIGDVLIRHPWALHRGSPNVTDTPRALVTIRYVRRWYIDDSRDVNPIPHAVWESLTQEQQHLLRFPVSIAPG
jgi:hypothetical protein